MFHNSKTVCILYDNMHVFEKAYELSFQTKLSLAQSDDEILPYYRKVVYKSHGWYAIFNFLMRLLFEGSFNMQSSESAKLVKAAWNEKKWKSNLRLRMLQFFQM